MKKSYLFSHLSAYFIILNGLAYYICLEFLKVETEFGLQAHPFQKYLQGLHIVTSPLLIFSFGLMWNGHILKKIKNKASKLYSGLSLIVLIFLMTLTGYLIQVIYEQDVNDLITLTHLIVSALFTIFYVYHHFKKTNK